MGFPRPRKWPQGNVSVTGELRCLNQVKDVATNALAVVRLLLGPWSGLEVSKTGVPSCLACCGLYAD